MKVLFIARATLYQSPGGDTIQILKTAEALRNLDVVVDIGLTTETFNYEQYDIVHFFNIIRPADILFHFSKAKKKVISSIFVDYSEAELLAGKKIRSFLVKIIGANKLEYIKAVGKAILGKEEIRSRKYLLKGHLSSVKYIHQHADAILPNSYSEQNRLEKALGKTNAYIRRIVNGVDIKKNIIPNKRFDGAIICVGRIERLKNQLMLINVLNTLDIPAYIIGKPAINDTLYAEECKKIAKPHIQFIENLPQEEVFAIMKAAKVHVLPSWFETTGLASLEAAYYGCNVVVSKKGDQEEYFKNFAYFCKPDDENSIKEAILKAYHGTYNNAFHKLIEETYTWEQAANQTKQVYQEIL